MQIHYWYSFDDWIGFFKILIIFFYFVGGDLTLQLPLAEHIPNRNEGYLHT